MKNKRFLILSLLTIFIFVGITAIAAPVTSYPQVTPAPVFMYETALLGPDVSSSAYPAWASNTVWQIYHAGQPATLSNPQPLGSRLLPLYISQPTALTSNTVWYVIHVKAVSPSYMFTPSNLMFVARSSDPANSLVKTNFFNNPNYTYSPWAIGVRWGINGPRTSDTILDDTSSGSWNNQPVNEFIFIGAQSKYYVYSDMNYYSNSILPYVNGFTTGIGFSTTGSWMLLCSNVTALSQITLQTQGSPRLPVQTVQPGTPAGNTTDVNVGVNMETNRTIVVQFKTPLNRGGWTDICTMNASDTITWPTLTSIDDWNYGFFRYYIEQ